MNPKWRKKKPKLPPSEDALWLDELYTECGKAAARCLKADVNLERPIKSLTLVELKRVAAAVEHAWIKSVVERMANAKAPMTEAEKEAYAVLLGV